MSDLKPKVKKEKDADAEGVSCNNCGSCVDSIPKNGVCAACGANGKWPSAK